MSLPITALYIIIFSLLYILLSMQVINLRQQHAVSLGDGGHDDLRRAIAAHANFAQYVPLMIIIMAMSELSGLHAGLVHMLGFMGLYSRGSHMYSLLIYETRAEEGQDALRFRKTGMVGTFAYLALGSSILLIANFM